MLSGIVAFTLRQNLRRRLKTASPILISVIINNVNFFSTFFLLPSTFVLGLAVGSFLNVIIERLSTHESVWFSRSRCDHCHKRIFWCDNIPLLSFILLGGKCRHCKEKISIQNPLVELVMGGLFSFSYYKLLPNYHQITTELPLNFNWISIKFQFCANLLFIWFIISALVAIFIYDLRHQIIPDEIVYPAIIVSLIFTLLRCYIVTLLGEPSSHLAIQPFSNYFFSAVGTGLFFLGLVLITKGRGMGGGDIKLGFLMGLVSGWPYILLALYLAFLSGAFISLVLIAVGLKRFGQTIPFGPFLSASTIVTLLYGECLLKFGQTIFNL